MSEHASHAMHEHSLAAYRSEEAKLHTRDKAVLEWIRQHGPHTDREVMRGLGFTEPGAVRPRITELISKGCLMEVCSRKDEVTGKTVRVVDVRGQRTLL